VGFGGELFVKQRSDVPADFFAVEAAGLRWLADAGGVAVLVPREVRRDRIALPRVRGVGATAGAAEEFGRALAATHLAGASHFGYTPHGADGYIATLTLPQAGAGLEWGPFYARHRLRPFATGHPAVERVCARLEAGELGGPREPPARIHGDLWSGNVLWAESGAVLIDPAAHGGHRETDLAMLALFGFPHLDRVIDAYHEAHPLADGWRERVALHQLHPLLVHATLFGGGYANQAAEAAARYA
jgi:fructosamine-3-kinase